MIRPRGDKRRGIDDGTRPSACVRARRTCDHITPDRPVSSPPFACSQAMPCRRAVRPVVTCHAMPCHASDPSVSRSPACMHAPLELPRHSMIPIASFLHVRRHLAARSPPAGRLPPAMPCSISSPCLRSMTNWTTGFYMAAHRLKPNSQDRGFPFITINCVCVSQRKKN